MQATQTYKNCSKMTLVLDNIKSGPLLVYLLKSLAHSKQTFMHSIIPIVSQISTTSNYNKGFQLIASEREHFSSTVHCLFCSLAGGWVSGDLEN